jgi:BRCA1-associated protein
MMQSETDAPSTTILETQTTAQVNNNNTVTSRRIRKRPVSFGNPALGTYHGVVCTSTTTEDGGAGDGGGGCRRVAMLHVPPHQVPEGILHATRAHREYLSHMRIIIANHDTEQHSHKEEGDENETQQADDNQDEDTTSNNSVGPIRTYLVLIELTSPEAATEFVNDLDGVPYTSLDPDEVLSVEYVTELQGEHGVLLQSPHFAPHTKKVGATGNLEILPSTSSEASSSNEKSPSMTISKEEIQNCAVCLEPMVLEGPQKSSILTTVCNHTFHLGCLLQWQDSPCPVCRYDHSGLNDTLSTCHVCGTTDHNYVCLICGVISCVAATGVASHPSCSPAGDEQSSASAPPPAAAAATTTTTVQAQRSFAASHARKHYDETLHAYALDTTTQHVWDFAGQGYVHRLLQNKQDGKLVEVHDPHSASQERSTQPGLSDQQETQVLHRKLEGFASQYYTLLKSQLEQQRSYYQAQLEEIKREFERQHPKTSTSDLLQALRQERKQLSNRHTVLQRKQAAVQKDVQFLKSMNESLEANKAQNEQRITRARQQQQETRDMLDSYLPALEAKLEKLMIELSSGVEETKAEPNSP